MSGNRTTLCRVSYDNFTRDQVIERVAEAVIARRRVRICTPNAHHVVLAQRNAEFREAIRSADLVVSDGMLVVYGSRLVGKPLVMNVGGRLLIPALLNSAKLHGVRVFLLGSSSSRVVEQAAATLAVAFPGVELAGAYCPPHRREFGEQENAEIVRRVNEARPNMLFVGLGTPKQEIWLARHAAELAPCVSIGIGAGLDMLGGAVRYPPAWMTAVGLEWLHRLIQEPRRLWRRYLVEAPQFLWLLARERRSA